MVSLIDLNMKVMKIMLEGDWVYKRFRTSTNWSGDSCTTKEEAIAAAPEEWGTLYVGQLEKIEIESPIFADEVINAIGCDLDNNHGNEYSDYADDFVDSVSADDEERLQELLDESFYKWVEERNIKAPCFNVINVEQIKGL